MSTGGLTPLQCLYASFDAQSAQPSHDPYQTALASNVHWHVAHPVNTLVGPQAVRESWLAPLWRSLPDLERRPLIAISNTIAGATSGEVRSEWHAGTGFFLGTFSADLFGIPATGKALYLRYTELVRLENNRIAESYLIPDFLEVMIQAGVLPLPSSLGHAGLIPGPATLDGVSVNANPDLRGAESKRLVLDMLDCLRRYDGNSLLSMDLENYWHRDFMWYGPGGIGTTRGIAGFRSQHQGPFLAAFPDRDVDHHAATIACGDYVATGGWPHMHGTHTGSGWLGTPATGRRLEMRVMDIWRREGDRLRENWVAIDICHMLSQMGLDVFAQMRALAGET